MIIISHRGNLKGRVVDRENHPSYIDLAIDQGFDVEIDIWVDSNKLLTGHDYGMYPIDLDWLLQRESKLWIHCKNLEAIVKLKDTNLNYFFHENDQYTLTSKNYIWSYPSSKINEHCILVMPEMISLNPSKNINCLGVCTDNCYGWKFL